MWRLRLAYRLGADPNHLARPTTANDMEFPQARLLVFVKAPVPGQVKTRLTGMLGKRGAARLYMALRAHAQPDDGGQSVPDTALVHTGHAACVFYRLPAGLWY